MSRWSLVFHGWVDKEVVLPIRGGIVRVETVMPNRPKFWWRAGDLSALTSAKPRDVLIRKETIMLDSSETWVFPDCNLHFRPKPWVNRPFWMVVWRQPVGGQ